MITSTASALLFPLLLLLLTSPSTALVVSDCTSCDHSLTAPVYYGCIGDSAYVTFDSVRVDCASAVSLNVTSSIPTFYYPDAEPDALYTLLMMDTTRIDPIVGTQPPFLPFPIIYYGAMNIPGDVLPGGMSMDKFHYDSAGVRVNPFWQYTKPVPAEEIARPQPDFTPPPLDTRAFNYEFILGKQRSEKDDPNIDTRENWEFVGFLKRTIFGNPVASTYFSTGYCVKDIDVKDPVNETSTASLVIEEEAIASDCPVPPNTGSGIGSVPEHVKGVGGYGSTLGDSGEASSNGSDASDGSGGSGGGSTNSGGSGQGDGSSDSNGAGSGSSSDASAQDDEDAGLLSDNGAFGMRISCAAVMSWVVALFYGIL